jgi:hypothetical protein
LLFATLFVLFLDNRSFEVGLRMKRIVVLLLVISGALMGAAQDTNGAASAASPKSIPMDEAIFFIKTDSGGGVAFLLEDQDGVWMVSNINACQDAEIFTLVNANGVEIAFPDQLEVAATRNLIRFRTDQPAGLRLADGCEPGEEIFTFSRCVEGVEDKAIKRLDEDIRALVKEKKDAKNGEVEQIEKDIAEVEEAIEGLEEEGKKRMAAKETAQKLKNGYLLNGQAVALGPDRIEMSALITWHDSGGPVVNAENEVIGISSHLLDSSGLPSWVTEGTRFDDTRRFALKHTGTQWVPISLEDFLEETGYVYENYDTLQAFADIAEALNEDYTQTITSSSQNLGIQRWIKGHDKLLEEIEWSKNKRYTAQNQVDRAVKKLEGLIEKDIEAYARLVKRLGKEAAKDSRVSIPSYRQQLIDLEELYGSIWKSMDQILDSM